MFSAQTDAEATEEQRMVDFLAQAPNMTDEALLGEVASLAGLDPDEVLSQLDTNQNLDELAKLVRTKVELGRNLLQQR